MAAGAASASREACGNKTERDKCYNERVTHDRPRGGRVRTAQGLSGSCHWTRPEPRLSTGPIRGSARRSTSAPSRGACRRPMVAPSPECRQTRCAWSPSRRGGREPRPCLQASSWDHLLVFERRSLSQMPASVAVAASELKRPDARSLPRIGAELLHVKVEKQSAPIGNANMVILQGRSDVYE